MYRAHHTIEGCRDEPNTDFPRENEQYRRQMEWVWLDPFHQVLHLTLGSVLLGDSKCQGKWSREQHSYIVPEGF